MPEHPDYEIPRFFFEGQEVWAPYNPVTKSPGFSKTGTAIKCTVICAAGNAARVVNEKYDYEHWWERWDVRVKRKVPDEHKTGGCQRADADTTVSKK